MFATGYPSLIILKVTNNTEQDIENIEFFFEGKLGRTSMFVKKLKRSKTKQTGISTIKIKNNDLNVCILDKTYLVKQDVKRHQVGNICIDINEIEDGINISVTEES